MNEPLVKGGCGHSDAEAGFSGLAGAACLIAAPVLALPAALIV
ncbi:hypothetical protein [Victivallis sp. Marseille-Q1083]|nr:hypothetical protein [Victivallis sp. Marseille-Q1083]